jgi:hypothetical protein
MVFPTFWEVGSLRPGDVIYPEDRNGCGKRVRRRSCGSNPLSMHP